MIIYVQANNTKRASLRSIALSNTNAVHVWMAERTMVWLTKVPDIVSTCSIDEAERRYAYCNI